MVVGETRYYPNGQKEIEGGYDKEGKKTGLWTSWYPSGKVSKEENYLADKKNGRQRDFYESGKPNFESNYKNNIPDGDWIFYDGQGNKKSRIVFKDGRKVGQ
jgi:antitoxin component YwqK of YwqJK toxin-antitoxin module